MEALVEALAALLRKLNPIAGPCGAVQGSDCAYRNSASVPNPPWLTPGKLAPKWDIKFYAYSSRTETNVEEDEEDKGPGRATLSLARRARARITVRVWCYGRHISHWLAISVRPMAYQLTAAARSLLTAGSPGRLTRCSSSRRLLFRGLPAYLPGVHGTATRALCVYGAAVRIRGVQRERRGGLSCRAVVALALVWCVMSSPMCCASSAEYCWITASHVPLS